MKNLLLTIVCSGLLVLASSANGSPIVVNPETRLDVTYTAGQVEDGPLSLGLLALPSEVNAMFLLGSPAITPEPGDPTEYGLGDVALAEVSFGDGLWTDLANFSMLVDAGNVTSLSYRFSPIDTAKSTGIIVLNFPLTITGTDTASGLAFEYEYGSSTQSIAAIPEPMTMTMLAVGMGIGGLGGYVRKRRRA